MSENFPTFNELAKSPFPECHWRWCCQFIDRCRNLVLPAEQLLALGHIFANARLVLRGSADHTMALVLDLVREQLPPATEVDQVENRCWERDAEPEFPVVDAEVQEPGEVDEESNSDCFEVESSQTDIIDLCSDMEMDSALPVQIEPAKVSTIVPETTVEPEEMVEATVSEPECSKAEIKQTRPSATPKYNPIQPSSFTSGESITLDSVCRDLVLFDDDFFKTLKYYNRISRGQLKLTVKEGSILGETLATIHVDHLVLSQATVMDRTKTIQDASKQFIQAMKGRCYSVETLHPKNALQRRTNLVQRLPAKTPEIDRLHYERIMRDFQARDNGCHLVFAEDFTDLECGVMQGIAARWELPGRVYDLPAGRKRFLVLAQELPPQDIVRRIVTELDAELGFQYRVSPPQRMGNSQEVVGTVGKPSAGAETSGLACGSSKPKPMKKSVKLPVTFACLTKFAPVKTLQSIYDVYRNLVLIGTDFEKTAKAFHKTKVGILKLSTSEYLKGGFNATVQVGKFLLVEAQNITKNLAKFNAKAMFFKKAEMYCYQIIKQQTAATEVLVTKREIPDSNQCKRFLEDFNKNSIEKELVFSSEFNKADLANFISIAKSLTMKVCPPEMDKHRRLRIVGHRLPALVIVERIVLANDPFLGGIYQVVPPKSGA